MISNRLTLTGMIDKNNNLRLEEPEILDVHVPFPELNGIRIYRSIRGFQVILNLGVDRFRTLEVRDLAGIEQPEDRTDQANPHSSPLCRDRFDVIR